MSTTISFDGGPAAVEPEHGRLDLFIRLMDGGLYHFTRRGERWERRMQQVADGLSAGPAARFIVGYGGPEIHLVYSGRDGGLWHREKSGLGEGGWQRASSIGSPMDQPVLSSPALVTMNVQSHEHLPQLLAFVIGADRKIWYRQLLGKGPERWWRVARGTPHSALAAISPQVGSVQVFARRTTGRLASWEFAARPPDQTSTSKTRLPPLRLTSARQVGTATLRSAPAADSWGLGRVDVFAVSPPILRHWWSNDGASPPASPEDFLIPNATHASPYAPLPRPIVLSPGEGLLEVVVPSENSLRIRHQDGVGWSDWEPFFP
jgi:hypothetical protein